MSQAQRHLQCPSIASTCKHPHFRGCWALFGGTTECLTIQRLDYLVLWAGLQVTFQSLPCQGSTCPRFELSWLGAGQRKMSGRQQTGCEPAGNYAAGRAGSLYSKGGQRHVSAQEYPALIQDKFATISSALQSIKQSMSKSTTDDQPPAYHSSCLCHLCCPHGKARCSHAVGSHLLKAIGESLCNSQRTIFQLGLVFLQPQAELQAHASSLLFCQLPWAASALLQYVFDSIDVIKKGPYQTY